MLTPRVRFAFLWLSQTARVLSDNCLRMFVVLQLVGSDQANLNLAAFYKVTVFFLSPFVLLTPFNGAISNALPKRWVLVGSSAFCLGVALLAGFLGGPWPWYMALVGVGSGIYSPTRYALLPAVAQDAHVPLPRVNGLIELGGAAGIVGGMYLGLSYADVAWLGAPVPLAVAVGGSLVSLLAALPVWFASDVRRQEAALTAVAGFFRDAGRVFADREARATVLGLACFLGLIGAGAGAVFAYIQGLGADAVRHTLPLAMILVTVGAVAGAGLAGVQGHPRRSLGLVPLGATGLLVVLAWAAGTSNLTWPCLAIGLMSGLVNVPLRAAYQAAVPPDARGNAMAIMNTTAYALTVSMSLLMAGLVKWGVLPTGVHQLWFLALLAAVGAAVAWWALLRDSLEQILEILLWPVFRIRGYGPGLEKVPLRGPLLVIANHAAYFDPLWLAKVLPRRLTPMMTSDFFDRPGLHFLMTRITHTIRVQSARFRRKAPELAEAVARLDKGECVLLFPEGWVRRKVEVPLRPFGQGIWHILTQRPETPVVPCWIEGGWGSYTSHAGGPPLTNKRPDFWRPIRIAVGEPIIVDPAYLADQRVTRQYLWHVCLETRKYLGLPPVDLTVETPGDAVEDRL